MFHKWRIQGPERILGLRKATEQRSFWASQLGILYHYTALRSYLVKSFNPLPEFIQESLLYM